MGNLHGKCGGQMDERGMNHIVNMENYIGYMVNLHGNAGMKVDKSAMKLTMKMGSLLNDHITI
jgi:hypothetical protein